jgi:photosystem II stability/assembly factor-like uncharacterized protein
MLKRKNLARIIGSIGMLALPVAASAAGDICYLRDATAPSAATAYLLCGQGMVYATTDAGGHWAMQRIGKVPELHASANMTDEQRSQLVLGTIFATDDGGKTWQNRVNDKKQNFTTEHLLAIQAIGNLAWTTGFDGIILHSIDGGHTWEKQTSGTTMALESVYFLNPDLGWAVGWSGTILRSTDGGKKWQAVTTDAATWSINTVYFRDDKNGWACGFSGELLASHDGGLTWQALKSPVQSSLSSVSIDKAGRIWSAADEQLVVSEDGGQTWTVDKIDSNLFLTKVFGKGDSLWALGELGLLKQVGSTKEWKQAENFVPAGTYIADSLESMSSGAQSATTGASAISK